MNIIYHLLWNNLALHRGIFAWNIKHGYYCWNEFHPYYWWSTHTIGRVGTVPPIKPDHSGWIEWLCRRS